MRFSTKLINKNKILSSARS